MSALQYIYGYHPVIAATQSSSIIKIKKIFLVHSKYHELKVKFKTLNFEYELISLETMNNLLKTTKHQNIAAEVKPYQYFGFDELMKTTTDNTLLRFLILDRISDPHNFGAMLRIGAGNDFDAVIVLNRNQAQVNGVVAKAAAGALSVIPICQVNNLAKTITYLKDNAKFWVLAAAKTQQAINYNDQKLSYDTNIALIIGSEGEGISPLLLKKTDFVVQIPMSIKIESFNASVACGIIANYIYLQTIKIPITNK